MSITIEIKLLQTANLQHFNLLTVHTSLNTIFQQQEKQTNIQFLHTDLQYTTRIKRCKAEFAQNPRNKTNKNTQRV